MVIISLNILDRSPLSPFFNSYLTGTALSYHIAAKNCNLRTRVHFNILHEIILWWYCIAICILHDIRTYRIGLHSIAWCMILHYIGLHWMVKHGIAGYWVPLHGIACWNNIKSWLGWKWKNLDKGEIKLCCSVHGDWSSMVRWGGHGKPTGATATISQNVPTAGACAASKGFSLIDLLPSPFCASLLLDRKKYLILWF